MLNELKNFQVSNENNFYDLECERIVSNKVDEHNKQKLDLCASTNFIYTISADIHGGCSGLFDFGPTGSAIKENIVQEWRNHFIIEDDMLEVESCMLTPYPVLETSGHVEKFSDFLVRDCKTNDSYRADKIVEAFIDNLLESKESINMSDGEKQELKKMRSEADACSAERLDEIISKLGVKAPATGNDLTPATPFKLMFDTQIGPTGKTPGFLRPETAQGIFTNFHKLLQYNNNKMPFAAAQVGHSFRNEIAPRGGLLRVREFQMAEIEHFCNNEENYYHPKFDDIRNVKLRFLERVVQLKGDTNTKELTMGNAYDIGLLTNTTLGYYMARTQLFLEKIGVDYDKIRFRQHKFDEMAHYAGDCWDAEIYTSYGWIECVGHADRACYDLSRHMEATGVKLQAEHVYDEPKEVDILKKTINKKKINKTFRKDSKPLLSYLDNLSNKASLDLADRLKNSKDGSIELDIGKKEGLNKHLYDITKDMFSVKYEKETVYSEHYTPMVVEPSFGIGRIMYGLLENILWDRPEDENRLVLSLRPRIAPIKVGVIPLSNKNELINIAAKIHKSMKRFNVASKIDDSGAVVGRKYSRFDQMGVPFDITVDFQTVTDNTVTVRERDTTKPQIRVSIKEVPRLIRDLSTEEIKWSQVVNKYPHHTEQTV